LDPRVTALVRPRSNCPHPLVREDVNVRIPTPRHTGRAFLALVWPNWEEHIWKLGSHSGSRECTVACVFVVCIFRAENQLNKRASSQRLGETCDRDSSAEPTRPPALHRRVRNTRHVHCRVRNSELLPSTPPTPSCPGA
jgi:hypothetical protein